MNGKRLKPGAEPTVFIWCEEGETRPNPLNRVRQEFHESDISDSDEEPLPVDMETPSNVDNNSARDNQAEILLLQSQLKQQQQQIDSLQKDKDQLEKKLSNIEAETTTLNQRLEVESFGVARFGTDDVLFRFYTGFVSVAAFMAFFEYVKPSATNMQRMYYKAVENLNTLAGRPSCMKLVDELFLFLCRLRLGLFEEDLAERFNCSVATVSRKVITWANLLYFVLGSWNIWLPKDVIQARMPESFKDKYSSTRVIIDCTEIKTQVPKSLVLNSQLYSHYKGANTFKGLIGIAPHGAVTFVSCLYTGCMSDVEITKLSGLIELLEKNDSLMADKGFTIEKLLKDHDVALNIPPFLHSNQSFTPAEVSKTQEIAKVRIHVERAIARIKLYNIFSRPIPITLTGTINQLWTVAALLTNFQGPLINQD
jgi:hypothetical protein